MAQRALTRGNAAYCSECAAETPPDAAACARCGATFEGSMDALFCPICNSINRADATECVNCNANFPEPGSLVAPRAPQESAVEEEYLRRILQLSREKARAREGQPGGTPQAQAARSAPEPVSALESDEDEGELDEALWKLAEPFDRMIARRRRRLEQMDALIERARVRIKNLEESTSPTDLRERDELKRQIEELLLEKEDILKLEEGLVDMENTYRNILRMQKDELKARETSLRSRIDAFRHELETREKAFGQMRERESDIGRREDEFRRVMNRMHERERELEKREELLRDKARLLDERHHALSGAEVDLERRRWELEQRANTTRAGGVKQEMATTVTVKPSDQELGELRARMVTLEEQMERLMEERNRLAEEQQELVQLRDEFKVVLKDLDDLLGELPDSKIREFAKSETFARYEKVLDRLQLG